MTEQEKFRPKRFSIHVTSSSEAYREVSFLPIAIGISQKTLE